MATRPDSDNPWPQPTQHSASSKGKRKWDLSADEPILRLHHARQSFPASDTNNSCGIVANNVISCFPTPDATVVQNMDTRFVWNTGLPQFSQTNLVDVYLFHADSDQVVSVWPNNTYSAGHLAVKPNDTWWGEKGLSFTPGTNSTQPFFFVLVVSGAQSLSQPRQSTFTATQTNFPDSVLSSQSTASLASAAAASASAASAASVASSRSALSASSAASSSQSTPSANGGALQNGSSASNSFPSWGIALLAVFGFLAFVSFLVVFWLMIRKIRTRKKSIGLTRRNSIGSESPMMANLDAHSPTDKAPGSSSAHGEPQSIESGLGPLPAITRQNVVSSDGASTVSRADSAGGPFSAIDAAAMAAAFRNVMRKPDFADRPMEEGESPEKEADVLNRELAEEGRDIRSVSSSRGVRVETLSDTAP
ncbi:hypothetical protein JB92DRAFT_201990 [Gautieria morchelliformis]|nr:hypothetical protein JB92DRAFT_201990 [Gautieria morchelliformis]